MAKIYTAKDPDEVLDYRWTVSLETGDTLASGTIVRVDGSAVLGAQDADSTGITFWVSGGTDGEATTFRAFGTTIGGRSVEETLVVPVTATDGAQAFLAAFPAFSAVSASSIAYWATKAARAVDDSWPDNDREHALNLLTAHLLTLQGLGTGAEAEAFAAGAGGFKRIKSGALEIERFDANSDSLKSTSYGQQFAALLGVIKGGPRITGTGTIPCFSGWPGW